MSCRFGDEKNARKMSLEGAVPMTYDLVESSRSRYAVALMPASMRLASMPSNCDFQWSKLVTCTEIMTVMLMSSPVGLYCDE